MNLDKKPFIRLSYLDGELKIRYGRISNVRLSKAFYDCSTKETIIQYANSKIPSGCKDMPTYKSIEAWAS